MSWAFTILGMDQQDLYVETIGPCPAARRCYLHDGVWKPVRVVTDTIRVKDDAPHVVRLEFTEHGPLIHEDTSDAAS